jgi:predicted dinucleotide-binding enzyme
MNYNVTVVGAGRMGSALATALFHMGFATTVWNRTGAKTMELSRLGLNVAQSLQESVQVADIVVVSVSDYSSTRPLLRHPDIEKALRGKIVVQLSSGSPRKPGHFDILLLTTRPASVQISQSGFRDFSRLFIRPRGGDDKTLRREDRPACREESLDEAIVKR